MANPVLKSLPSWGSGAIAAPNYPTCQLNYTRDTWVKLRQTPNPYAADEAKLLCRDAGHAWVVWVPNHGEVVLDRSEFWC
ncbi:hypothetical protein GFS31_34780 [Leptolyngbya sp. BL0902]|uniref:hypothetical protein n=1 Tax=Leptolyngbya sp. BL0902 TaxID=1115757 RepID=UPI001935A469|nr:hypothetical protein [Leptolyngbya sp. BL0902]QQE66775.1 hypothetical protein GFS31_34780 [Leptolyngbya sp. BL0902]